MVNFYNVVFTETVLRGQFFPCHLDIKLSNERPQNDSMKLGMESAVGGLVLCESCAAQASGERPSCHCRNRSVGPSSLALLSCLSS